jgi:hypothetical protein
LCKPAKVHSYERDHAGNYTKEKMQYHVWTRSSETFFRIWSQNRHVCM